MLASIPPELRALPQWVVASGVPTLNDKEGKVPRNPRTGQPASVTDPTTWGTFDEATAAGYRHVGFVLSQSDPFCIVDLDDPATLKVDGVTVANPDAEAVATIGADHRRIFAALSSYAELSQSGTGIHIICRGSVPHGVRRDRVEIYSDARYMICTGNVIKQSPITDQQPLLTALFQEMEQGALGEAELVQVASHLTDDDLFNMASTAANAAKFMQLWRGEWQGVPEWPTQSEADFALLAMLGFYSPDNEQVRRMFRWSGLAREKTNKRDYHLNKALAKIRGKTPPPIDLSILLTRGSALVPPSYELGTNEETQTAELQPGRTDGDNAGAESETETQTEAPASTIPFPPGFVGELAGFVYSSAIRPVPEIALCAALALTAGVVGRSFNISGTGLNQYLIVLAGTGKGKEGAANGIDAMLAAARPTMPMIDEFKGPGAFASGQALVRVLDKNPCFVSVLGEVGLTFQQLCSPTANAAQVMLKKVLLDIYTKSGWTKTLAPSVYSDSERNTKIIQAPNVTLFGESTPEVFYSGLDSTNIAEGLIPRFSIFEYTGPRPDTNPNAFHAPAEALVRTFAGLAAVAVATQHNKSVNQVQQDPEARAMLREYDRHATREINTAGSEITKQLWNRAHLKALKMSALISVGINPHNPVINKQCAEWAIALINRDVESILNKFESGETGTGDVKLELHIRKAVGDFLRMSPAQRIKYKCPEKMLGMPLVPFHYLRRRAAQISDFRNDRRGMNSALKQVLTSMVEADVLSLVGPIQARNLCNATSPVYGLGATW